MGPLKTRDAVIATILGIVLAIVLTHITIYAGYQL